MSNVYYLLLCEGVTDQILISYYLGYVSGWKYSNLKDVPFADYKQLAWYQRDNHIMGIWPVGGNSFDSALNEIARLENCEHKFDKIAIITDNDSNEESNERYENICNSIVQHFTLRDDITRANFLGAKNQWITIDIINQFKDKSNKIVTDDNQIEFCFLLIPNYHVGTLESCVLDYLSDNDKEKKDIIDCVKSLYLSSYLNLIQHHF